MASHAAIDSSVETPWLRRLKVSRRHDGHADLVATGRDCALETFLVQHETDVMHAWAGFPQRSQHFLGVRHLWHTLRVHEAGDFHAACAAGNERGG